MTARKAPGAAPDRRSAQALDLFEKAMKSLGKRDHAKARDQFDQIVTACPEEHDIVERARLYRGMCERALEKKPALRPKSVPDLLIWAVYHHNRGEFADALKLLAQAAELEPDSEHVLYCTAAAAAQLGDTEGGLVALRGAIRANPASRAQALSDPDLAPLRERDEFFDLLDSADL